VKDRAFTLKTGAASSAEHWHLTTTKHQIPEDCNIIHLVWSNFRNWGQLYYLSPLPQSITVTYHHQGTMPQKYNKNTSCNIMLCNWHEIYNPTWKNPFHSLTSPFPLLWHALNPSLLLDHVAKCLTTSSTVHHTAPVPSFHISVTYKNAKHPSTFHCLAAAECILAHTQITT